MARKIKPVSISSIAAELGVSPSAVSRAINNRAGVSEETRRRVGVLLEKYRFRPAYPASRLPRVAVVTGSAHLAPYSASVLSGICRYVCGGTISAAALVVPESGRGRLLDLVRDQQCSAVILIVPACFAADFPVLSASGLPVMLVDETVVFPGSGYIDNDSRTGSLEAARYLIGLGHRRIGYIVSRSATSNHRERFDAYREALAEAGIGFDPALAVSGIEGGGEMEFGFRAMRELLSRGKPFTALMATNDEIALGAISAAREAGLRIPADLSVIGFDDNAFSAFIDPPLTTVRHDAEQAGFLAARAVDEYLQSGKPLPREIRRPGWSSAAPRSAAAGEGVTELAGPGIGGSRIFSYRAAGLPGLFCGQVLLRRPESIRPPPDRPLFRLVPGGFFAENPFQVAARTFGVRS